MWEKENERKKKTAEWLKLGGKKRGQMAGVFRRQKKLAICRFVRGTLNA